MIVAIYDTETTGIIRGHDFTNPDNPYLASIAVVLYDDEAGRIQASFNAPIQPVNWVMPSEAGAVNGLTTEFLMEMGLPFTSVMAAATEMFAKAELCVAHNADFDRKIMASSLYRFYNAWSQNDAESKAQTWLQKPHYCTMQAAKPVVQALDKRGRIKNPKLTEAYEFFFNRPLSKAHSANADAIACLEIYLALCAESKLETTIGAE